MANPNIIFIMADDMGWGDLSCYGAKKIATPNMDRIAAEGIRFRDAHSPSAVCTPSRYGVVTGRYCWRTWLKRSVLGGFGSPLIEPDRPTVGSFLKQHGYTTASVGKWHLGLTWTKKDGSILQEQHSIQEGERDDGFDVDYTAPVKNGPTALGFDYSFNISGSLDMSPYCFIENDRCVEPPDRPKEDLAAQQRPGMVSPGWRRCAIRGKGCCVYRPLRRLTESVFPVLDSIGATSSESSAGFRCGQDEGGSTRRHGMDGGLDGWAGARCAGPSRSCREHAHHGDE